MKVEILSPGLQTSVQDFGRPGWRRFGAPGGGAADPLSLALANWLVGNAAGAAALECTLKGPDLVFQSEGVAALVGATMDMTLDGAEVPANASFRVRTGQRLSIDAARYGARAYLALHGGVTGPSFLGSRSAMMGEALEGTLGRALKAGDVLETVSRETPPPCVLPGAYAPRLGPDLVLRAAPGPEAGALSRKDRDALFLSPLTADARSDRTGVRLGGLRLAPRSDGAMRSSAVFPGTIQCPEDGMPILLGPDARTTGGYPRIAQVICADRHLIGQIRPGASVWLRAIGRDAARETLKRKRALYESFGAHAAL